METDRKDRPNTIPWPPLIVAAAIAFAWLMNRLFPLSFEPGMLQWLGFALFAGAAALDITAMVTMSRANTTIMPHQHSDNLVTHGIFAFSRNPIYVANIMILLGLGFVLGNAWYFAAAVLAFRAISELAIKREEAHLQANFGERYS